MQIYWGAGVVTAALVVALLYLTGGGGTFERQLDEQLLAVLPDEVAITQQELVANISRTTRWQAPSDQWLSVAAPDLFGLPELGDPSVSAQLLKEKG